MLNVVIEPPPVPHLVHEDRTELTDIELTQRVARWFEVYEGRTFYLPPGATVAPLGELQLGGPTLGAPRNTALAERRQLPVREPHPRALRIDEQALAHACKAVLARRFARQHPVLALNAYALEPDR